MCSYPQNETLTDIPRNTVKDLDTLSCPECGKAMIRVKNSALLQDGVVIPDLERWQCLSCKANFFDLEAMDVITEFRKKTIKS